MSYKLKKLYNRYFQKSRSFLVPVLGIKRETKYPFMQSYVAWEDVYSRDHQKLVLTYARREYDSGWDDHLLLELMASKMFDEYQEIDEDTVAVSFDLNCIEQDYMYFLNGTYSKLGRIVKQRIRDYYGPNSPEWVYMETFLFPAKHTKMYSYLLDVDEEHIKFTGELCDKPNFELETLKLRKNAKINDVHPLIVEPRKDIQDDSRTRGLSVQ
jgi:hypothetical protein